MVRDVDVRGAAKHWRLSMCAVTSDAKKARRDCRRGVLRCALVVMLFGLVPAERLHDDLGSSALDGLE